MTNDLLREIERKLALEELSELITNEFRKEKIDIKRLDYLLSLKKDIIDEDYAIKEIRNIYNNTFNSNIKVLKNKYN